jgi:immune inhibitor A
MSSEGRSNTSLFFIALAVTMAICLGCLGSGLLAFNLVSRSRADRAVTPEEPTEAASVTRTPGARPSELSADADLARATLHQLENTIVPINDPIELAERLRGLADVPRIVSTVAIPIDVGSVETFWVSNNDTIENFEVQAELAYATEHVYFWIEQGIKYEQDDVAALVDEFEKNIYPTDREFFGSEWTPGVDGDVHLYILYARNLGATVAGYFSPADELSPLAHRYSNAHEMFYLSADNVELWEAYTASVLAHEFQHMIHWNLDRNEQSWLNEGFSELAAHLNGFDVGGWDFAYADDTDIPLTFWPTNGGTHYGQSFLFVTYFLDRFGSEATKALVADPNNGLDSVDDVLKKLDLREPGGAQALNADQVYRDWAVTLLVDDPALSDGRYSYSSYSPPQVHASEAVDECPSGRRDAEVEQYGLDYIRIQCQGVHSLSFDGDAYIPVLGAEAHSGDFAFWSNRGDESDMMITREFDLTTDESAAEFSYWTWYDIEQGWDYLYLEVSSDGGETWQILETPSGTDEDLSGNSYGWAYTGMSGGGDEAEWIKESVDLTPYLGEKVLLRFEYITDAAVNGDGLLLDDLSIDAIGYAEDFEAGENGWDASGFVRLYNRLPQAYSLAFVKQGQEPSVTFIPLDENNSAQVSLDMGDGEEPSYLIVIGMARHTWQPAYYEFQLDP